MGILYNNDLNRVQLRWFKEAARLRGTSVKFFETLTETKDIYTDVEITKEQNPIDVDILFEGYPQNRPTLDKYGWYDKNADDNPDTAFVPLDLETLRRWQHVLIPSRTTDEVTLWRLYHVTRIATRMEHPFYWVVALAPVFPDNAPEIDRSDNFNFIDWEDIENGS